MPEEERDRCDACAHEALIFLMEIGRPSTRPCDAVPGVIEILASLVFGMLHAHGSAGLAMLGQTSTLEGDKSIVASTMARRCALTPFADNRDKGESLQHGKKDYLV